MSIASCTSPPASALTLPISRVIRSVSSAFSRLRISAKRKRISPRSGAGTSRHSSYASRAAFAARSTSSLPERGKVPIVSPVAGLRLSKVSPPAASTHSPPTKFLKVFVPVVATGTSLVRRLGGRVGVRERAGRTLAPPVADDPVAAVLLAGAAVGALPPVDDDRHVRVVLVVLDHLVEELRLELSWDHAIDHPASDCRQEPRKRQTTFERSPSGADQILRCSGAAGALRCSSSQRVSSQGSSSPWAPPSADAACRPPPLPPAHSRCRAPS